MNVECIYANEKEQYLIALAVPEEATIETVILASGTLENFPELVLETLNVGIFGRKKGLSERIKDGDRVEIYRPLFIDPMQARRKRAPAPKRRKY